MSRDLISSLVGLAVAAYFAIESYGSLKLGTLRQPGAGFFPFLGGVVLGFLSLVQLLKTLGRRDGPALAGFRSARFLLAAGATLAYLLLLERVGFVTITFLFLLLLFLLEYRRWAYGVLFALAGAVSSYALFRLWLKTQLPAGPFGF